MKRLRSGSVGLDSGDVVVFSDFEDGGEMWTGRGQRERRKHIKFSESYRNAPIVQVSVSLWDVDTRSALRADVVAEAVTEKGFDLVFRTWGDTKIARVRAQWTSMGELLEEDDWVVD